MRLNYCLKYGVHYNVIEQSGVLRSVLVTSHYANREIEERALSIGTKTLPKQLAEEIPITVDSQFKYLESAMDASDTQKSVDIIVVDDDREFANNLRKFLFTQRSVDLYHDPLEFLKAVAQYPKDTKICLDNNFAGEHSMKGLALAEQLHNLGYTKLYLLSGDEFKPNEIPSYLTAFLKTDIDNIEKI